MNSETFDGKPSTLFNVWWKSVTKYLSFYPETSDQQKIAWVGTLLTGTAKAWDLHHYDTLGENNSWVNYVADNRTEYHDPREAANAQLKLSQLKYSGDIRAYMTEFRALNNYARATSESLQEKIDLAMTDVVLDIRFAYYMGEFGDDEGFLEATYQAALQVEKKKALKQAREQERPTGKPEEKQKTEQEKRGSGTAPTNQDQTQAPPRTGKREWESAYGKAGRWGTKDAALKGVPPKEQEEYSQQRDNCWRCGRSGYKTFECFSFNTTKGTPLPTAPWKVSAVAEGKRKRSEELEEPREIPQAKKQKVAAVDTMETDAIAPLWESDSDF